MVLYHELIVRVYSIFDLHSNMTNATCIICLKDWYVTITLWLVVKDQFQVDVDHLMLEKDGVGSA